MAQAFADAYIWQRGLLKHCSSFLAKRWQLLCTPYVPDACVPCSSTSSLLLCSSPSYAPVKEELFTSMLQVLNSVYMFQYDTVISAKMSSQKIQKRHVGTLQQNWRHKINSLNQCKESLIKCTFTQSHTRQYSKGSHAILVKAAETSFLGSHG